MIKVFLFGFIFIQQQFSFASIAPAIASNLYTNRDSIYNSGITIGPLHITKQDIKAFEKYTGKKMNFMIRIYLKRMEKKLKKNFSKATTSNNLQQKKQSNWKDFMVDFNAGGFFLGFLLPVWGVLIAYLIKDKQRKQRIKWAWIGFATMLTLGLIFVLILALNGGIQLNLF